MSPPNASVSRDEARGGRRVIRCKVTLFVLLGGMLLLLQYPIGSAHIPWVWGVVLTALLLHCVVMLIDGLFELYDEHRPAWANSPLRYLLPVEPRGFAQLVTLVGLIAVMMVAMEIRDWAGFPPEGFVSPMTVQAHR